MTVFNDDLFIKKSIESILNQSFQDFEFIIIVEHGSNSSTIEIVRYFADKDQRIRTVFNEKKLNIASSLNVGLDLAYGEYIARMDADDIALPERLYIQNKFLDEHKDVDICVADVIFIDKDDNNLRLKDNYPLTHEQIKAELLFSTCIRHPTVMMRNASLKKAELRYNPDYSTSEDYEFWNRACHVLRIIRLPNILLLYRWHGSNATILNAETGINNFLKVMANNFEKLGLNFSYDELHMLCSLTCEMNLNNFYKTCRFINKAMLKIIKKNKTLNLYDSHCLKASVEKRMFWKKNPHRLFVSASMRTASFVIFFFTNRTASLLKTIATYIEIHGLRKTMGRILKKFFKL